MGIFDEYGPKVGGYRYKKYRPPESLTVTILKLAALGVVFSMASILSPTFLSSLAYKYLKYKIKSYNRRQIQRSLYYLKQKKFIAFSAHAQKPILTKLGLKRVKEAEFNSIEIKPRPWDGLWRFLGFDIPEDERDKRFVFRQKLKALGFFHFQQSIFLLPYPCDSEINKITQYLEIEQCVHIITGSRFSGDKQLVKKFGL